MRRLATADLRHGRRRARPVRGAARRWPGGTGRATREERGCAEGVAETAGEVLPGPERAVGRAAGGARAARPAVRRRRGRLLAGGRAARLGGGAAPAPGGRRAAAALDARARPGGRSRCACRTGGGWWRRGRAPTGATSAALVTAVGLARARGRRSAPSRWCAGSRGGSRGCGSAVEDLGRGDLSRARARRGPGRGGRPRAQLQPRGRRASSSWSRRSGGLLAFASHELRSPLARLRVVARAAGGRAGPQGAARRADIAELDALIGELLLASRLERWAGRPATRPSTCSASWPRRRRASRPRSRASRSRCAATRGCCAAWSATCSRTRGATAGRAVEARVERAGDRARGCGGRPRARASPGPSASASSSPSTGPPGAPETGASSASASRWCARSPAPTAASALPARARAAARVFEVDARRLTREGSPASNPPSIPPPEAECASRVASSFVARRPRWPRRWPSPRTRRSSPRTSRPRSSPRAGRRCTTRSATRASPSSRARRRPRATCASASRTTSTTSAASRCRTRTCSSTARAAARRSSCRTATSGASARRGSCSPPRTPSSSTKLTGVDAVAGDGPARRDARPLRPAGSHAGASSCRSQPAEGLSVSRDGALRAVGETRQRPLRRAAVARGRPRPAPARPLPLGRDPEPHARPRRGAPRSRARGRSRSSSGRRASPASRSSRPCARPSPGSSSTSSTASRASSTTATARRARPTTRSSPAARTPGTRTTPPASAGCATARWCSWTTRRTSATT